MRKLIAATVCAAAFSASAETTNTVTQPVRIVVTATRTPTPIRTVAKNPAVITAEDIADGRYSSIPEVLQKKAGVFVSNWADNPSQAQVNLRGFGGDAPFGKTLVLLNGRKLNRPDMASVNWAQIPMQAVERIEVIRGPNSVLYGDHAVGGVINIITKEPAEIPKTTLSASIASHKKHEQALTTSGKVDGLGYVATLGHQSGEGYRDRSRYDTLSGSLRLTGDITENVSAYTEISTVKEHHQFPGALSLTQLKQDRRQASFQAYAAREKYINIQAGTEALLNDELIFNLDGGFSHKDLEIDNSDWLNFSDNQIDTYTLSPKITLLTPLMNMNNELTCGIDLTWEEFRLNRYADGSRTIQITDTEITKETLGGYIANTLDLTDKLLFSSGFRMEENKVNVLHDDMLSPYADSIKHTEEAWQTALIWLPTDTIKLFAGIDRTYRYPFIDEQASYWGFGTDYFNKDLKPETGINYELGIECVPVSNLILQATVFRTDMEGEIAPNALWINENMDETTHRGIELSAAYTHDLFALDLFYTWLQSEFTKGPDTGNEIPWVPQNQFDVNLAFFLTEAMTLNTHMSYVGSMFPQGDTPNNSAHKQSAYAIVDLLLQYELPIKEVEATLFAGIDNVFATKYNYLVNDYPGFFGTYGAEGYYPAPERTFKAGLSITF